MKLTFTKLISKKSILILNGNTKREVLDSLISEAAKQSKVDRNVIMRMVWNREKMMTTGVGFSLALPHVRVNDIANPLVLVGLCKNPIKDYESQDEEAIRVIVFTIAPDRDQQVYLNLLGNISRKLRHREIIQELIDNITRPSMILRILKRRQTELQVAE
jgi:PTS system nitrogen regulatory IIA component